MTIHARRIAAAVAALSALTLAPPAAADSRARMTKEVIDRTNAARAKAGRAALRVEPRLMRAAQLHAEQMARSGRLDHVLAGASYPRPEDRLATVKYPWQSWAENVAFGQEQPAAVMQSWMTSKGHMQNLLNPSLTDVGVGWATDAKGRAYWVQVFARPARAAAGRSDPL